MCHIIATDSNIVTVGYLGNDLIFHLKELFTDQSAQVDYNKNENTSAIFLIDIQQMVIQSE